MNTRGWIATAALFFAPQAWSQCRETHLTPAAIEAEDRFGSATAIHGDVAVVGAPHHLGEQPGAAFVYERVGLDWVLTQTLVSSSGQGDGFGGDVAVSGDRILVGAPLFEGPAWRSGAVYVFERDASGWIEAARLEASDGASGTQFGGSVALHGDLAVVGATGGDAGTVDAGAAYVFDGTGGAWTELAILAAEDGDPYDSFGCDVALEGGILVVGALYDDHSGWNRAGSAYLFELLGGVWVQSAKLVASDPGWTHEFGAAVDIDGTTIAVGSPRANFPGAAYVFERGLSGWIEKARITPLTTGAFGLRLCLQGDLLVVGGGRMPSDRHVVELYRRSGSGWAWWRRQAEPNITIGDGYVPVALDAGRIVVGAPGADTAGIDSGTAFLYEYGFPLGTRLCTSNASSTGEPALITAYGSADLDDRCLELRALPLPPGEFGYFLMSRTDNQVPLPAPSQGTLCLGLPIVRFSGTILGSGNLGILEFAPDLGALPQNTTFLAGETWRFQAWFRDINPYFTSNTSDAVAVTFE